MASFADYLPKPSSPSPAEQVDMIWAMGFVSLVSNNYQIIIPLSMASSVGTWGINEMKSRLSRYLDEAPTMAYRDARSQTIRICRASDYDGPSTSISPFGSPLQPSSSPASTASSTNTMVDSQDPSPEKKAKVPRPPNAFILYRKHHHPLLKEKNPDMHNNEVSVILGKQWNGESEQVKNEYRARAEKIKKKHAIDNPGYQYAPRKPSEKKRRMTARKLAQLRATSPQSVSESATPSAQTSSAADYVGITRASNSGHLSALDDEATELSVNLPAPQRTLQQQVNMHQRTAQPDTLLSFDDELQQNHLVSNTAPSTQNDQDFLNSLIDWDGIRGDARLLFGSTAEETQDLAVVETADADFNFSMIDEEFNAELERLSKFL